jgi:hypothetical protein
MMDIVLHPLESGQLVFESQIERSTLFSWNKIRARPSDTNRYLFTFLSLGESQRPKSIIEIDIYERCTLPESRKANMIE